MSNRNFFGISALYYLMGVVAGLLGSLLVYISNQTETSLSSIGLLISFFNVGALLGIGIFHSVSKRYFVNLVISLGAALMASSLIALTLVTQFTFSLLVALLLGIGFGVLDLGLVQLMTRTHETSVVRVNISNAVFGLGGVSGALAIHLFSLDALNPIAWAALFIAIPSVFTLNDNRWKIEYKSQKKLDFRPHGIVLPILSAMAFYVALEISAASWLPSISAISGAGPEDGALATSLFYLFFTAGRFIGAPIAKKVRSQTMIISSLLLSTIPLTLAAINTDRAFWFVALTGLTLGPLYANSTSFLARVTPDNPGATTYLLYSAMAGSLLIFPLVGYFVDNNSTSVFPLVLLALLTLSLIAYALGTSASKKVAKNA